MPAYSNDARTAVHNPVARVTVTPGHILPCRRRPRYAWRSRHHYHQNLLLGLHWRGSTNHRSQSSQNAKARPASPISSRHSSRRAIASSAGRAAAPTRPHAARRQSLDRRIRSACAARPSSTSTNAILSASPKVRPSQRISHKPRARRMRRSRRRPAVRRGRRPPRHE